jgi:hypothetical protein
MLTLRLMLKKITASAGVLAAALPLLAACSSGVDSKAQFPDKEHEETYKQGSLLSDKGGFDLFGGDKSKEQASGLTVNAYLWRGALDTVSFMPLTSVDPFGGVILTDWYSQPDSKERLKLTVLILDRVLRADGVKVKAFKQVQTAKGHWVDAAVAPGVATKLEETILMRARQLKLAQKTSESQ